MLSVTPIITPAEIRILTEDHNVKPDENGPARSFFSGDGATSSTIARPN